MPVLYWIGQKDVALKKNNNTRNILILCTVLVVVTFSIYMQVANHEFLLYDDPSYVTDNPHVSSGLTLKNFIWAFTSVEAANWHPITWLSHMVDVQIFGMSPMGHHIVNVIIHTISAILLFILLYRCSGELWQSAFVAFMFALHPLHVESVAWVAERKDVLSAFFWSLTLLLYVEYSEKQRPFLYIVCIFSFLLGLMSKPMLVTLPIVMLLMDYWPLNRYQFLEDGQETGKNLRRGASLLQEKIPFFACSLFSGAMTIYAQFGGGAGQDLTMIPMTLRIENAIISYAKYMGKTFWPHNLTIYYPWARTIPLWQTISSLSLLLLISLATIRFRHRFPYLIIGWFWFLITLIPVIGFLQVGDQCMADRYSYIPLTGLFIMVAWGVPDLAKNLRQYQLILAILAAFILIVSSGLTWQQLGYWQNGILLFQHDLEVVTNNYVAHYNLGNEHLKNRSIDSAIMEFKEALRITPNLSDGHYNLGIAFSLKGNLDAAIQEFQEVLRLSPNNYNAQFLLGAALSDEGYLDDAMREFNELLRLNPNDTRVINYLNRTLAKKRDVVKKWGGEKGQSST